MKNYLKINKAINEVKINNEVTVNIRDIDEASKRVDRVMSLAEKLLKDPWPFDACQALEVASVREKVKDACNAIWKIQMELNKIDPRVKGDD